jgi:hypothetical protein
MKVDEAKDIGETVVDQETECFCGSDLEAGLCPNGHDPITLRQRMGIEIDRHADAVVEAAVAWHESGQEGGDGWFEAGERLTRTIESLTSIRSASEMPRRRCSVHNQEEFKYESLEHELNATERPLLTELQSAYNQGVEDAKYAIRATITGGDGDQFKPYFINQIARTCSPHRYTGGTPPFTATEPSPALLAAREIAALSYARHRDEKIIRFAEIIERHFGLKADVLNKLVLDSDKAGS